MLIAMMASTFERVREQSKASYMYLTAMVVVCFAQTSIVPPPLLILGLPYHVLKWLPRALKWSTEKLASLCAPTRYAPLDDAKDADAPAAEPSTDVRRNSITASSPSELKPPSQTELHRIAATHLEEHASDVAQQDERWRARIFKVLSKASEERSAAKRAHAAETKEIKEAFAAQSAAQAAQAQAQQEMQATLRTLVAMMHVQTSRD